jgi:hypothetical protein
LTQTVVSSSGEETPAKTKDSSETTEVEKPAESSEETEDAKAEEKPASDEQESPTEARQEAAGNDKADDDSNEAVGKEEAAEQDRDMMNDNENEETMEEVDVSNTQKVTTMFQKILSLGGQAGQVVMKVGAEGKEESEGKQGRTDDVEQFVACVTSGLIKFCLSRMG